MCQPESWKSVRGQIVIMYSIETWAMETRWYTSNQTQIKQFSNVPSSLRNVRLSFPIIAWYGMHGNSFRTESLPLLNKYTKMNLFLRFLNELSCNHLMLVTRKITRSYKTVTGITDNPIVFRRILFREITKQMEPHWKFRIPIHETQTRMGCRLQPAGYLWLTL